MNSISSIVSGLRRYRAGNSSSSRPVPRAEDDVTVDPEVDADLEASFDATPDRLETFFDVSVSFEKRIDWQGDCTRSSG